MPQNDKSGRFQLLLLVVAVGAFVVLLCYYVLVVQPEENAKIHVAVDLWPGNAPGLFANGGLAPEADSINAKMFKVDVSYTIEESAMRRWELLQQGRYDVISATIDQVVSLSHLEPEGADEYRIIAATARSQGGHGIVTSRDLVRVEEILEAESIAGQRVSPQFSLAAALLREKGFKRDFLEKRLLATSDSDLASAFRQGSSVILAQEPRLSNILTEIDGLHVAATSWRPSPLEIVSVLVANKKFLDRDSRAIGSLLGGWMHSVRIAHTQAGIFASSISRIYAEFATLDLGKWRSLFMGPALLMGHRDNLNLFGAQGEQPGSSYDQLARGIVETLDLELDDEGVESRLSIPLVDIGDLSALTDNFPIGIFQYDVSAKQQRLQDSRAQAIELLRRSERRLPILIVEHFPQGIEAQDDQKIYLKSAAAFIKILLDEYPGAWLQVLGHADRTGTIEANKTYSEARASWVAAQLGIAGIEERRIKTKGLGHLEDKRETEVFFLNPGNASNSLASNVNQGGN